MKNIFKIIYLLLLSLLVFVLVSCTLLGAADTKVVENNITDNAENNSSSNDDKVDNSNNEENNESSNTMEETIEESTDDEVEPVKEPYKNWNIILVNKNNTVPNDYEPDLMTLSNGQQVDKKIYPDLQAMMDALRNEGYDPIITWGYRTNEVQKQLFDKRYNELLNSGYSENDSYAMTASAIAVPGTSEHELGLAVDIASDSENWTYEIYDWLSRNSYKYGFNLRYPSNKTDITGIIYEPWHFRYVGKEVALELYNSGQVLEEYLGVQ